MRDHRKPWRAGEELFLRENYGVISAKEIASHVGRPEMAVMVKANRLGLKGMDPTPFERIIDRPLVAEMVSGGMDEASIGDYFGVKPRSIYKLVQKEYPHLLKFLAETRKLMNQDCAGGPWFQDYMARTSSAPSRAKARQ